MGHDFAQEGREAFAAGRFSCPYKLHSEQQKTWRRGWLEAALKVDSEPKYDDRLHPLEADPHRFTADASDLEWKPGQFEVKINTRLGNGMPFLLRSINADRAEYVQCSGCLELVVFND